MALTLVSIPLSFSWTTLITDELQPTDPIFHRSLVESSGKNKIWSQHLAQGELDTFCETTGLKLQSIYWACGDHSRFLQECTSGKLLHKCWRQCCGNQEWMGCIWDPVCSTVCQHHNPESICPFSNQVFSSFPASLGWIFHSWFPDRWWRYSFASLVQIELDQHLISWGLSLHQLPESNSCPWAVEGYQ